MMLNPTQLMQMLQKNAVNIAVLIVALVFAGKVHNWQKAQIAGLQQIKDEEIRKNAVMKEMEGVEKKLRYARKALAAKEANVVIEEINAIAKQAQVKIVQYAKPQIAKEQGYQLHSFDLNVEANDYHTFAKFISALENSPTGFAVHTIQLRPEFKGASNRFDLSAALGVNVLQVQE